MKCSFSSLHGIHRWFSVWHHNGAGIWRKKLVTRVKQNTVLLFTSILKKQNNFLDWNCYCCETIYLVVIFFAQQTHCLDNWGAVFWLSGWNPKEKRLSKSRQLKIEQCIWGCSTIQVVNSGTAFRHGGKLQNKQVQSNMPSIKIIWTKIQNDCCLLL